MYQGVQETSDRSLRMRNVECSLSGVRVSGSGVAGSGVTGSGGGGILVEEGCSITASKDSPS
ncbi:MAG: hypothetical protein WBH66_02705, partial [Rectinemataceae bacterium]